MKLKRFLLRYDPPGIGLEVEENGEVEVRHQDLPPVASVTGAGEISTLADDLLDREKDLLSKRRHRSALVQMLGRLYQMDVTGITGGDEEDGNTTSPTGGNANAPTLPPAGGGAWDNDAVEFTEGMHVVLVGLRCKLQAFNGEVGTLVKVKADKQKYEVELHPSKTTPDSEVVKVKGAEFLVPVATKNAGLNTGDHVAIRGLRNHTELNGCLGRVVETHKESHRYEVRATETGQLFRVKQENLVPIARCPQITQSAASKENREPNSNKKDVGAASGGLEAIPSAASMPGDGETLEPGSLVELTGLKTAMAFNGQQAEVLSVDTMRGRYEIRLNDGSVKTIRADNVRLISAPAKTTPRTKRKKGGE